MRGGQGKKGWREWRGRKMTEDGKSEIEILLYKHMI